MTAAELTTVLPTANVTPDSISDREYRESIGETLLETLAVENWDVGRDLDREYRRILAEVKEAVGQEDTLQLRIREKIFPLLKSIPLAPKNAGVHAIREDVIPRVRDGLLFSGGVEACDGTLQVFDTLPLSVHQVGIALVSFQGKEGTWCQRLFRRDIRVQGSDPVDELAEILNRRGKRSALNHESPRDRLSQLLRRGVMAYAERAVLLRRSKAVWRMGHGNPAPLELLTGSSSPDPTIEAIKMLRELILDHQKFLFVPSESSDQLLYTIGHALPPMHYAIVKRLSDNLDQQISQGHFETTVTVDDRWDGKRLSPIDWVRRFRDEVASKVVVGVYRAAVPSPAQIFFAHEDHSDMAAHIAVADSLLQPHRGFPMLIDLADHVCATVFGGGQLDGLLASAYSENGAAFRYQSERSTRHR